MKQVLFIFKISVILLASILVAGSTMAVPCCQGLTGNVDNDPGDNIDIGDITALIDFLFISGTPPVCMEEANCDGDLAGNVDIGDLTALIDFLFISGSLTQACLATDPFVFIDEYGPGVTYQAFGGSKLDAVSNSVDSMYAGTQGLEVAIPGSDPWWSGGAFVDTSSGTNDLSGYNALTFWAKASTAATLDVAGLGNDNTGTSKYQAEVAGLALTTSWQKYVIPIPLAEKLSAENGLFYFAEGEGIDYQIWIDEIIFEDLSNITNIRPALAPATIDVDSGGIVAMANGTVTFDVGGSDIAVSAMPGYFTYISDDPSVVFVEMDGSLSAVGVGTANITANLGSTPATGSITVNVSSPAVVPTTPAPTPTVHPDSVISLYSDAYTDVTMAFWSPTFAGQGWDDGANVFDETIGSDNVMKFEYFGGWGLSEISPVIDVSSMTHFHMDIWTPDPTAAPVVFNVKLVDFGANGVHDGGGDDVEHELTFDESTMSSENWVSIDVPLASFTGLVTKEHLAQLVLSGGLSTVYVDNIYFYDAGVPSEPTTSAPTPSQDPGDVISVFSDTYTSTDFDTWSSVWDDADVADFTVGSDNMKVYTNLVFSIAEYTGSTLDISSMTHFHIDVWTPFPTVGQPFNVKLVDFGANGVYDGGGDDTEGILTFTDPVMQTGQWVSIDVPLADFTTLNNTGNFAQLILSGDIFTVYLDNVYFYNASPTAPTSPAPTPSYGSADVKSLYSDAYTNETMAFWSPTNAGQGWDDGANVFFETVGSDNILKFEYFGGWGLSEISPVIDVTTMTHFSLDIWVPEDPTGKNLNVKLVDFGPNGTHDGGGDDSEHQLTFTDATITTNGSWITLNIAMADFTGLAGTTSMAQLVISGDYSVVFVDNVLFHK